MISFFNWNGHGPGGMSTIILKLAKYLTDNGQGIKVMCNDDSYLYKKLSEIKSDSLFLLAQNKIERKKWHTYFNENDCLVITSLKNEILELKKANPKIFFYQVYPDTLLRLNSFKHFNFKFLNRHLVKKMFQKDAVAIMDLYPKNEVLKKLQLTRYNPPILPVFVEGPYQNSYKINDTIDCLKVTYIGRAAGFKIYPAIKIYKDLAKSSALYFNQFEFHIITDKIYQFKTEFFKEVDENATNVYFHDNLSGADLTKFLCNNNIHLHFGMGISVLEGAKNGIPSVIVDASYVKLPNDYRYRWLFDTEGYEVGQILDNDYIYNESSYLMVDLLEKFKNEDFRSEFSEKTYKFILDNFSEDAFLENFILYNSNTKMSLSDVYPLFVKNYIFWIQEHIIRSRFLIFIKDLYKQK